MAKDIQESYKRDQLENETPEQKRIRFKRLSLVGPYETQYEAKLLNRETTNFKFKINHNEYTVQPDRHSKDYFDYLDNLSNHYNKILGTHELMTSCEYTNDLTEGHEKFKSFLAMLVDKFSTNNFVIMANNSCKDYVPETKHVNYFYQEYLKNDKDLIKLCWSRFKEKTNADDTFNERKVKQFYSEDPEYEKLLEIAQKGVDFEIDPNFVAQTNELEEPIRPLQQKLQKVYEYHIDKLLNANRAIILNINDITTQDQKLLNICSLHLAPKPSTDELPLDPEAGDRKGRLCFDLSNRADNKLSLNGGTTKELNHSKYGKPTNPTMGKIVYRWIKWKVKNNYKWCETILCRQDVDAAFNRVHINPNKVPLMSAIIRRKPRMSEIVLHEAGNFGHSSLPGAYNIIAAATKRAIEKHPNFKGTLSVCCDDYIFLTLQRDHQKANAAIIEVVEERTFSKGAISAKKKLWGQEIPVYGFLPNLRKGTIRPMDKGLQKLTNTIWLFDENKRQPVQLWQCLSSLCEFYSHAIRGSRPLIRAFEEMITTANSFDDQKAKATPLTIAIIEMWRIMTLILFYDKKAYSVSLEEFCRSSYANAYDEEWEEIEQIEDNPQKRFRMISDAGPCFIGVGIYSFSKKENTQKLLCYTSIDVLFRDPQNNYQTYREYLSLFMSLALMQTYLDKIEHNQKETVYVEWQGDNTGALKWAEKNKATSKIAQVTNLLITWFSIVSNIQVYHTEHIPGTQMIELGIDALSRPEKGIPHNLPPKLYLDLQGKLAESGISSHLIPNPLQDHQVEDVRSIFKEINNALHYFCSN